MKEASLRKLYMVRFYLYSGEGKTIHETVKRSGVPQGFPGAQGFTREAQIGGAERNFRAMKLFYMILYIALHICQNPQNHTTQTAKPKVNYELQLIIMYQYWLINCNKCTTLINVRC